MTAYCEDEPAAIAVGNDDDIHILRLPDLDHAHGWQQTARVVIDATDDAAPSLPALARIVRLRRRLRDAGGDLVVAASPAVTDLLRSNGLHWVIPCRDDLASALSAVRQLEEHRDHLRPRLTLRCRRRSPRRPEIPLARVPGESRLPTRDIGPREGDCWRAEPVGGTRG